MTKPSAAIAGIAGAELLCTSLWFSVNGAGADALSAWGLGATGIAWLTNAAQAGFIAGTLLMSLSGLADRFAASRIFAMSSAIGAASNAMFITFGMPLEVALALRFFVGLSLAGIYPLGMKLVVTWSRGGSSMTLALLVGMLAVGTAVPHLIRASAPEGPWQWTMATASVLAIAGGLLVMWIGDGPFALARSVTPGSGQVLRAFRSPAYRAATLGYFGHMWELYAFWTLVPFLVAAILHGTGGPSAAPLASFAIIASGAIGCVAAGYLAAAIGSAWSAATALAISGLCCFVYPLLTALPASVRLAVLCVWGVFVVADSAQFSSLSSRTCPPEWIGSVLAFQNAVGFAITLVSIWLATSAFPIVGDKVAWALALGPVFGLWAMKALLVNPLRGGLSVHAG
jgi:hypothetical protein